MVLIDTSTAFGAMVARRLKDEEVIWLVTARQNGTPEPSPVWFLWDGGDSMVIYSQRNKPKLRNIERTPRVALHLNTNATGGNVVIFYGTARIASDEPLASDVPAFVEKYQTAIKRLGVDPAGFAQEYAMPIRVTLDKLRGFE